MQEEELWCYGDYCMPAAEGLVYCVDGEEHFLAARDESFVVTLDKGIESKCDANKRKTEVYDRDGNRLTIYHPESMTMTFAFFKVETPGNVKVTPIYGQIVFQNLKFEEGLLIRKLRNVFHELRVR